MHDDVTALILAGGKATRMGGVDKRELVVAGRTIFEHQLAALAPITTRVVVSSARDLAGYVTVRDAVDNGGPLAGIAAGLAAARTPWLLVVAGDMPGVTAALFEAMLAKRGADVDAIGVRTCGLPEPLVSVLRVSACLPNVEARLARRELKASRLLGDGALRVAWLDDVAPALVRNVNVPDDL